MKRLLSVHFAAAMASSFALAVPAHAVSGDPRLSAVEDFAFALGVDVKSDGDVSRLASYDLVVVDGELTPATRVAQLRGQGAVVLGYLSVGTIEPFRSWYRLLKPFRLADSFEEFDEYYARASAKGYRRAIAGRIAPKLLRRGFDGLFLDNTDMVEGHPKQRRGMRRLVARLAALVHARGGFLFAQNGDRSVAPLLAHLDGWNREDVTWTYSFKSRRYVHRKPRDVAAAQSALRRVGAAGLLVTASDYTAAGDQAAAQESVANACSAGAVPFVSNIALRRIPAAPLRCPP
jgi:hypothetical protein